jgi:ribonuclease HII
MKIVAIDECGRGSGYGPISIGMLPLTYDAPFINKRNFKPSCLDTQELNILNWASSIIGKPLTSLDSKKITPIRRKLLFDNYKGDFIVLMDGGSDITHPGDITTKINHMIDNGISLLGYTPDLLLCDGSIYPYKYPYISITKGDYKYPSIGLASVLCKYLRDIYIQQLSLSENPLYDLYNNKGYLTPNHINALSQLGLSTHHRPLFCNKFI